MLAENASDPEMGSEAAHMLRTLAEQSSGLYPIQPEYQQWPAIQTIWRELEPETQTALN